MTDERSRNSEPSSIEDDLLTSALRTPALSQEGLERVRAAVEREWRATIPQGAVAGKRRTALSSRLRWFAMAAAAVVAAVGVTSWVARLPVQTAPVGSISRTDEGALSVLSARSPPRNLTQGGELRVGDRVTAQGPALVALARGGTLRISGGSEVTVISPSQISLGRGLIYLDIPPSGTGAGIPLRVITS
jgi:hypothetical protein